MKNLILFGTSACHLCEQAELIVHDALANTIDVAIKKIDIAEQTQWQPKYAMRIPVLYHPQTHNELGWPFDHVQVNAFIKALTDD
ncbi:MAG: glutaredoxin family protein [Methylovulum sp.]